MGYRSFIGFYVILLALAGCFRDGEKKEAGAAVSLPETVTGPLAFALNQPLVDINIEPVVLSWSPSSGATSYDARVSTTALCENPLKHSPALSTAKLEIYNLEEGTYFLCVVAQNDLAEQRAADNNGVQFQVDRTPPRAEVDKMPSLLDNPTAIKVKGDGVTTYRYKASPAISSACTDMNGYSNAIHVTDPIVVEITGADQSWTLCLLGIDQGGNQQAVADASSFSWAASAVGKRYGFNLNRVVGKSNLSGTELRIEGRGLNGWTDGQNPRITLKQKALGVCLNSEKSAFDAVCPHFIDLSGTSWQFSVPESVLTAGDAYEIIVQVDDGQGGRRTAGLYEFHWRYGFHGVHSNGQISIAKIIKDQAGNLIMAGDVKGSLTEGVIGIPPPKTDQSSDWFVAKNKDSGTAIWSKRFDGAGEDVVRDSMVDAAGDIYLLGTVSLGMTSKLGTISPKGKKDLILMKLKGSDGSLVWQRAIQSTDDDHAGAIILAKDGAVAVTGSVCGATDFGSGTAVQVSNCNVFLAHYTALNGSLVWVKNFTGNSIPTAWSLTLDADGSYYLVGDYWGAVTFDSTTLTSVGGYDGFVAKLSSTGVLSWVIALTGSGYEHVKGVAHDGTNLFALAQSNGAANFGSGAALGASGQESLLAFNIDPATGVAVWSKVFGKAGVATGALDLVATSSGHVSFIASTEGSLNIGGFGLTFQGGNDLIFADLSTTDGSVIEAKLIGNKGWDAGSAVRCYASGGEVLLPVKYSWHPPRLGHHELPYVYYHYSSAIIRYRP